MAMPPPGTETPPPTYSAGPEPSSKTHAEWMLPFGTPPATCDHLVPSHLAIESPGAPCAIRNVPHAYSAGPVPSSKTVSALTVGPVPLPSADHVDPSHLAMQFAATPPAAENW